MDELVRLMAARAAATPLGWPKERCAAFVAAYRAAFPEAPKVCLSGRQIAALCAEFPDAFDERAFLQTPVRGEGDAEFMSLVPMFACATTVYLNACTALGEPPGFPVRDSDRTVCLTPSFSKEAH